ncbi:MAG: 50S ribosomal protein L31 [Richelia sp. CSU_2_1]|nr:50S ribosomal protein L31 [Microcoleus sp. SM1_3_4]NJR21775.1 50S ribosomal protein L31 [Richelia sp. CSU_2_1]
MAKAGIHPEWYPEAKVYCNGELVMTVGSTKPQLQVDVWSGNHPFYTGTQKIIDTEGRVERFMRKYGMTEVEMPKADATNVGPIKMEAPKAEGKAAKGKKKK